MLLERGSADANNSKDPSLAIVILVKWFGNLKKGTRVSSVGDVSGASIGDTTLLLARAGFSRGWSVGELVDKLLGIIHFPTK